MMVLSIQCWLVFWLLASSSSCVLGHTITLNITSVSRHDQHPQNHHSSSHDKALLARFERKGFISYVAKLGFGTPQQQLDLIVDTGSSALAIASEGCHDILKKTPCMPKQQLPYSKELSSTSSVLPLRDTVTYDRGYWTGVVVRDVVHLPKALNHERNSVRMDFAAIQETKELFDPSLDGQGVWGLGPRRSILPFATDLIETLAANQIKNTPENRKNVRRRKNKRQQTLHPQYQHRQGRAMRQTDFNIKPDPYAILRKSTQWSGRRTMKRIPTPSLLNLSPGASVESQVLSPQNVTMSPTAMYMQLQRAIMAPRKSIPQPTLRASGAQIPIVSSLFRQGAIENESFSILLCGSSGKLVLGSQGDDDLHASNVTYLKMIRPRKNVNYEVKFKSMSLGSVNLPLSSTSAIIDSGSTFLLLPEKDYQTVLESLQIAVPRVDESIWRGYCVTTDPSIWPSLTFNLDGFKFTIPARDYLNQQGLYFCLGLGLANQDLVDTIVLGASVLQGIYLHFDPTQHRIGFALAQVDAIRPDCGIHLNWDLDLDQIRTNDLMDESLLPDAFQWNSCQQCVEHGHAWCPNGIIQVHIDGETKSFEFKEGLCWSATRFFTFQSQYSSELFHSRAGYLSIEMICSESPMVLQCSASAQTMIFIVLTSAAFITTIFIAVLISCVSHFKVHRKFKNPPQDLII